MLLFEGGKYAIALYVGHSDIASSYGAAGADCAAGVDLLFGADFPARGGIYALAQQTI
jgi:hypothetical protein